MSLGLFQGFMVADHRISPTDVLVNAKLCEHCGKEMFVTNGQKYCRPCGARFLLPFDYEEYLALAPDHTHLERNLPHYDRSQ